MSKATTHAPAIDRGAGTGPLASSFPLLLLATAAFAYAVRAGAVFNFAAAAVGTSALAAATVLHLRASTPREARGGAASARGRELALALLVVAFGLFGALAPSGRLIGASTALLDRLPGCLFAALAVIAFAARPRAARPVAVTVSTIAVVTTLAAGVLHILATEGGGIDVLFLHGEAAGAIVSGLNPYTAAVTVPDGSMAAAPDAVIEGYPYPPVTAIAYALSVLFLGDPRFTSLAAWTCVIGVSGIRAVRAPESPALYAVLLLAALPGWPLVLRAAWTEPLSVALLALATFDWGRPMRSGLSLGLGLATKQYFLVVAPLLLAWRERDARERSITAAAVVGLTLLAGAVGDAAAFWHAVVEFHTTRPPRADGANLVGLLASFGVTWRPPLWLTIGTPVLLAAAAARLVHDRAGFLLAMALALATAFLLSSQAFANYWFAVAGFCALAIIELETSGAPGHRASEGPFPADPAD